ncbi:type II toxin-antitoxin system VapC family toxin [Methyloprofundus sp.]|uniref:type II toxin-antitoxin system VapC family toxin n=1 Tax=Methyloprofundus sp. TaxID=2020875 RepID=UPI003D0BF854
MAEYRYLLDTNILSDLIKNPAGRVAEKINVLGVEDDCCTSIIVACELRYGAAKKQSAKLSFNIEQVLNSLPILALEASVDEVYAAIRVNLEKRDLIIGQHDLLIAAHAQSLGLTVVTANEREFRRVENLTVENWLQV